MSQAAEQFFPPAVRGRWLPRGAQTRTRQRQWGYGTIAFCLLHIPMALLLSQAGQISTLHALAVLLIGIGCAVGSPHRPLRVAYVGAYITGAEVLWRMTNAQVFWEYGKYATATIFLIAILRKGKFRGPALMLGYFALLMPSVAIIVARLGPAEAQGYISFNLSGPFALMVAAWFFSQHKLSLEHIKGIFLAAAGPIIGIASITFYSIYTAEKISFTSESNYLSSGGFGPNQVSAALGLGVLFALMFVVLGRTNRILRFFMMGVMIFLAVQSALTFSRGGLYNTVGAAAFASVYLLRDPRMRRSILVVAVVVFVLGSYLILPRLETLTEGKLSNRFTSTDSTNRVKIVKDEIRIWRAHPLLGVGPGGSTFAGVPTAHTEFGRLPAEHGSFGLLALVLLLIAAAKNIQKAKSIKARAIAVCLIGWSFLFMMNAAMRLVAPAFAFGLACATLLPETIPSLKALTISPRRRRAQRINRVRAVTASS